MGYQLSYYQLLYLRRTLRLQHSLQRFKQIISRKQEHRSYIKRLQAGNRADHLIFAFYPLQHTKKYRFSKTARLKSRKKLQEVFSGGKRFHSGFIKLLYLAGPAVQPDIKCGVGVSSRYFKKAVDRNRIKRLLREAYRLQQGALNNAVTQNPAQVSLFLLYTDRALPDYETVYKQTGHLLKKLADRIHEMAP